MENPRTIELPKSGPVRWFILSLIFVFAASCIVLWMLPLALDDSIYLNKSIHLRDTGVIIQGTVVDLEPSAAPRASDFVSFRLTVEYTVDGQTYTVRNQRYVDGYILGEKIDVIYDPADPSISQVDFFQERWFDPFMELLPF